MNLIGICLTSCPLNSAKNALNYLNRKTLPTESAAIHVSQTLEAWRRSTSESNKVDLAQKSLPL